MKKLALAVLGLVGLVVVVVVAGFFLLPRVIDWNDYKPEIAAAVKDATGRDFQIDGDIQIDWLSTLEFSAAGIRLANAEGAAPSDMATIERISGRVRLFPLIGRRVVIESLVLDKPEIHLGVNAEGRPNWLFEAATAKPAVTEAAPVSSEEGLPIADLTLGDVRVERGRFVYRDETTGQTVEASDIAIGVSLASLASPLAVRGVMAVNGEPVNLDVDIASPGDLLDGPGTKVKASLQTTHLTVGYDGQVQQRPQPGLGGDFNLASPSVGKLAAWLGRPLDKRQPDPGPLEIAARFSSEGAKVALESATIRGTALQATASGAVERDAAKTKVSLNIESGVLDIDRYLPPPAPKVAEARKRPGPARTGDLLAGLSDEPLDLAALRTLEADITVAIDGIKVSGLKVGKIAFAATAKDGTVLADLSRLQLYGGGVDAKASLDATGAALAADVTAKIDKVRIDQLARATDGDAPPVSGVISAELSAKATGPSPKALARSLVGQFSADLAGVNVANPQAKAIGGGRVRASFPGLDKKPTIAASLTYNKREVSLDATLDTLDKMLSGERFSADLSLQSKLVTASYKGAVQQRPLPGLDGALSVDVTSVGQLTSWLGQPLAKGQPDPGPLRVSAEMTAAGERVVIRRAEIVGKDLQAKASGEVDRSGGKTKLTLVVESGVLDIDRYLPPPAKAKATAKPAKAATKGGAGPMATLSDAPLDLSALRTLDADVKVAIAGIKVVGLKVGNVAFRAVAKDGKLTAELAKLGIFGGNVSADLALDAASENLAAEVTAKIAAVKLDDVAKVVDLGDIEAKGPLSAEVRAKATGRSPKALVAALSGRLAANLGEVQVSAPGMALRGGNVDVQIAGPGKQATVAADVIYNKEKVALAATLGGLDKVLSGARFAADIDVASAPLNANYKGAVQQQPLPGLDGTLGVNVPSVAKLAAWLGEPLAKDQPNPGPLKIDAEMAASGDAVVIKKASFTGKALDARAEGKVSTAGEVPSFDLALNVVEANLDAYLPPEKKQKVTKKKAKSASWSAEPIDFSALRAANGVATVTLGKVLYRSLAITKGRLTARLKGGALTATVQDLQLAGGRIDASVALDTSGKTAKVSYDATGGGLQARPLLTAFAGSDRLSGTLGFKAKGRTAGQSEKALVGALNGGGDFQFVDGAIHGINLAATLRKAQALGMDSTAGSTQKTDFAELGGSYVIRDGVITNQDFKMLAPLLRVSGAGRVPMPPRTVDYKAEAKLVASSKGQGSKDSLAGLPIPIRITGGWDNPKYDVDWKSVFTAAALDPSRIANMPANLKDAASGFGVALPDLGGTGTGGGAVSDTLKKILTPRTDTTKSGSDGTTTTAPDPLKQLKGLFKK